jgi:HTH-type transcriptional regulator/antitoxin HigA
MDVRSIETEADFDWALREIEAYFEREPAPGTAEAARCSVLAALIGAYEDRHWAIEAPDPVDAIREVMAQRGLKPADLSRVLGSRSRASEELNRKRGLTMAQAWKLHTAWQIPADVLLRPTSARPPTLAMD